MHVDVNGPPERPTGVRHGMVLLAMFVAVLLYLDRVCLSTAATVVQRDLGIGGPEMDWVLSAFFWTYALAQLPAGCPDPFLQTQEGFEGGGVDELKIGAVQHEVPGPGLLALGDHPVKRRHVVVGELAREREGAEGVVVLEGDFHAASFSGWASPVLPSGAVAGEGEAAPRSAPPGRPKRSSPASACSWWRATMRSYSRRSSVR